MIVPVVLADNVIPVRADFEYTKRWLSEEVADQVFLGETSRVLNVDVYRQ